MSSNAATIRPLAGERSTGVPALVVGLAGLAVALIGFFYGWFSGSERPVLSWLFGLSFWLSISIGCLMLIQLFYIFDAGWSTVIRRHMEHTTAVFKYLALLVVPLLLVSLIGSRTGMIWKWIDPNYVLPSGDIVANDVLYTHKAGYLNVPFFLLRTVLYFGVFMGLAHYLRKFSFQNDVTPDRANYRKCRKLAAFGIPLTALALSFLAIDWFKSIEYHWFSTMYGVWFFAASMWSALAVTAIGMYWLNHYGPLQGLIRRAHFYLVGCLLLAFTVFWAYISFSEFFLQYSANIPEETFYWNIRQLNPDGTYNNWWPINYIMVFGHFLFPFLIMLFYNTKVRQSVLLTVAGAFLFMHAVDMYWRIIPEKMKDAESVVGYVTRPFSIEIWDIAMVIGVGGIFVWSYLKSAATAKAVPIHDPRIQESLNYNE